jgi:RNA recognition motif-containing protein
MSSDEQAQEAINALNQRDIDGKAMVVQQARPREEMQASKQNRGGNQGSYNKPYNENKSYNKSYNNNYGNNNGGGYKKRYDHDNEY